MMSSLEGGLSSVDKSNPESKAREKILNLKDDYNSDNDDLANDFLIPCLEECSSYRRCVGWFSSSSLITWSSILPKLIDGDIDSIKIVISANLNSNDKEAIKKLTSKEDKAKLLRISSEKIIEESLSFIEGTNDVAMRLKIFAWLVANNKLHLKFAFPNNNNPNSLFHYKIGIFDFPWGDSVVFTGSINESISAHELHGESFEVYRSWIDEDKKRLLQKEAFFEKAWNKELNNWSIEEISEETLSKIKSNAPDTCPRPKKTMTPEPENDKWRHQEQALEAFLLNKKGVLAMATGTGKTRTALKICKALLNENKIKTVIISTSGTDLLKQWHLELQGFVAALNDKFSIYRHFESYHERELFELNPEHAMLIVSRTKLGAVLSELTKEVKESTLLIHDEVHGLGSEGLRKSLADRSKDIAYILGLSATPKREYDHEGNDFIRAVVGDSIFNFELEDAIKRGILAPFNYHPLDYAPNQDDRDNIKKVYQRKAALKAQGTPMSKEDFWMQLSRVYKTSKAKLPIFEEFIKTRKHLLDRCIIFVEEMKYAEEVLEIVHKYKHDFHPYFAGEDPQVLEKFANGNIECVITCHRLSEGIDIQSLRNVIIFSANRGQLETIQRIGRCIRTNPLEPDKIANVVDFIREDPKGSEKINADQERCNWLTEVSKIKYEREQ